MALVFAAFPAVLALCLCLCFIGCRYQSDAAGSGRNVSRRFGLLRRGYPGDFRECRQPRVVTWAAELRRGKGGDITAQLIERPDVPVVQAVCQQNHEQILLRIYPDRRAAVPGVAEGGS